MNLLVDSIVIVSGLALGVLCFFVWLAHAKHVTLRAEVQTVLTNFNQSAGAALQAFEARIKKLEGEAPADDTGKVTPIK